MNASAFYECTSPIDLAIAPIVRAYTIPSSWYVEPIFHEIDRDFILGRSWQLVGHTSQIPARGNYLTAQIGKESILVVRGDEDRVLAYHNVCRHRGGPLATDSCGRVNMLQCRYHGWTYKLDGSLRGIPRFNRVDLFDRKDFGLKALEVQVWQGLLFIRLERSEIDLEEVLDEISTRIAPRRFESLTHFRRVTYDIQCNWKVYVDNYLEGYHLPFVHPELCDVLDFNAYVTETHRYHSLQYSPLRSDAGPYGVRNKTAESAPNGEAFYYFIFPNMAFNILPGRLQTNVVLPVAPDRTRVLFDYFYEDVVSPEAVERIEDDICFSDRVQWEDITICEHVQHGLGSSAYDRGRFSVECEQGVYHFQALLKESYQKIKTSIESDKAASAV